MRWRTAPVVAIALLVAGLPGCTSSAVKTSAVTRPAAATAKPGGPTIRLKLLQFSPDSLTVKVGTKVTWVNAEPITHTVTSGRYSGVSGGSGLRTTQHPNGLFDAKLAKQGDTTSYTFSKVGVYPYYCDIHLGMNAKILVTP